MCKSCSRKVTVYEITKTGAARKLSAATLGQRKQSTPGLMALPTDKTSTVENACDDTN